MPYLITKDYQRIIQTTELNAITSNDASNRLLAEKSTEAKIRKYLIQKYDLTQEFQSTTAFLMTVAYKGSNRVYLDAAAYSASSTYALNALVLQAGNVYVCITAILVGEAFNPAKWTLLGAQYDIFYVPYPAPLFDQDKLYYKDDLVWWKDKVYQAQKDSVITDHEGELQDLTIQAIRKGNVFPDDVNSAAAQQMWGTGVSFSFAGINPVNTLQTAYSALTNYTAGTYASYQGVNYIATGASGPASTIVTPGTNIQKWLPVLWTFGDNRNQDVVEMYLDMVVYSLCKRIAPNNVPEARHNAWLSAIAELKSFAKGDTTLEVQVIQPKQGAPVRFGGNVPRINSW